MWMRSIDANYEEKAIYLLKKKKEKKYKYHCKNSPHSSHLYQLGECNE